MLRRLLLGLTTGLLSLSAPVLVACSAEARPDESPTAVPSVPFSEVRVIESGGVDGRYNVLLILTDGIGLLMGRQPSAGQIGEKQLSRLRTLLESEQFRREVARQTSPEPPQCSDQVTVAIEMGPLEMSRTGPCPTGDDRPTPAFDEIVRIVSVPLHGAFDQPVPTGAPALVPVRLEAAESSGEPGYVITVDARGRGVLTRAGETPVRRTLPDDARDTLRLLLARLTAAQPVDCADPGRRRAIIGDRDPVTVIECNAFGTQPELQAAATLLEGVFSVR
jgi:hypothetical protein